MQKGGSGEVYHVSTEKMVEIREIVRDICELLGKDFDQSTETVPARPGHDGAYTLDYSKIQEELHWAPEISLKDGLQDVRKWVDAYWDELQQQPLEYVHVR